MMMNIDQVLKDNLTDDQYAAASDSAKEVLCLACAGSGKSRTLAYRIARLLAEGEPAEGIVAFTFTEKAAESIKRRVSQALSTAGFDPMVLGAMYIGTIHAYCQRILGHIDPTYRQYDVLDENRLKLYLISRYAQLGLHSFRSRAKGGSYFDAIKQVSDAWKTANDELIEYSDVKAEDSNIGDLLERIDHGLRADQYLDFSLMIRNVVEAMRAGDPRLDNGFGQLRHLMVDEYQDVNPCQEELIRLMHLRSETLFVVGDDDQSIYAWRGADVDNIIEFPDRYEGCSTHTLSQNFRSTEPIVQASDNFVTETLGPSRIAKAPEAVVNRKPQDIGVMWFQDRVAEAQWVAERIETLLGTAYVDDGNERGLTPADFAVLMRSTRTGEQDGNPRHWAFTSALDKKDIPFSLEAGGGPFDRPQTAALRSTFELLRENPISRNTLRNHFRSEVVPAYPDADFADLVRVLARWARLIHRPAGSTRIKLYPQQLVHELLAAFNVAQTNFGDDIMRDIGLFSQMILDVESVYMSVDSEYRFSEVLNFLQNAAETGYDVSTDDVIQRPDAVTVSTVHKMKGLEFPCVFIVDVEANRFPGTNRKYAGWLPLEVMDEAIGRGAYHSNEEGEIRLFYTAATRAERYLYVSGAESLPLGKRQRKPSRYSLHIAAHPSAVQDPSAVPSGLAKAQPRRRIEDADYPTNFSELRYYLHCPKSYQFRERYGFNPTVPELFGYGRTVHTSIQRIHELYRDAPPEPDQVDPVVLDTFHLKHVPPSNDPVDRPGAYERAQDGAVNIARKYVEDYGSDFRRERQVEAVFEIPAVDCVISGSIDLLLHEDTKGNILQAEIVDFKTMEGGDDPVQDDALDWTELSLQVQLYARAAEQVLGQNAKTGSVHLLKDNQRMEVPITKEALDAALANIEWAVQGILVSDFPMRPHPDKCGDCDFRALCPGLSENFSALTSVPPELHVPGGKEMARAFSRFRES